MSLEKLNITKIGTGNSSSIKFTSEVESKVELASNVYFRIDFKNSADPFINIHIYDKLYKKVLLSQIQTGEATFADVDEFITFITDNY